MFAPQIIAPVAQKRSFISVPSESFYSAVSLCLILSLLLIVITTCFVLQYRRRLLRKQPTYHHYPPSYENQIERGEGVNQSLSLSPTPEHLLEIYTDTPRPDSTTLPIQHPSRSPVTNLTNTAQATTTRPHTQPHSLAAPPFPRADQCLSVITPPSNRGTIDDDNAWMWSLSWRGQVQSYLVSPSVSEIGSPVSPTMRNSFFKPRNSQPGSALRGFLVPYEAAESVRSPSKTSMTAGHDHALLNPPALAFHQTSGRPLARARSDSTLRRLESGRDPGEGKRKVRTMEDANLWPEPEVGASIKGGIARQVSIKKGEKPSLVSRKAGKDLQTPGLASTVPDPSNEQVISVPTAAARETDVADTVAPLTTPPRSTFAWAHGSGFRDDSSVDEDYR